MPFPYGSGFECVTVRLPNRNGGVVIMPTSIPVLGEEAWFWYVL